MNISIIGSGSWGTAMANHLAFLGNNVKIWSFSEEEKDEINNERKSRFLKDITLDEKIVCSNDIKEVVDFGEAIFHITPSKFTRETFKKYKDFVGNKPVIICSKGFEEPSLITLDQVLKEEKEDVRTAVLSGPSFAIEVANHVPTAVIVASKDQEILDTIPHILSNEIMRIYKSNDVTGVEVGGALKNIIAFGVGICTELGFGTNAQSALITRGLAEIARLGVKMGGEMETFYGLSGLGDLILTCSSDESRNRRAGRLIGKGYTIEEAKKEIGQTVESAENIKIAKSLAEKYDVDMPIVNAAYDILYNNVTPRDAGKLLMTRNIRFENDFRR